MAIILNGSTGITTPDLEAATAQVNNVDVVTTTAPQTLTNKTLTNPTINGFTGDTSVINIGSGQFYKDASGNLGIGVTPSAYDAGNAFDIGSRGGLAYYGSLGAFLALSNNVYHNAGYKYKASAAAGQMNIGIDGSFAWLTAPSGTAGNAITFTQAMTLDTGGWLTIGTLAGTGNRAVYSDSTGKLTNSSSDARLKESITPLTTCLNKTLELKPVSYQWRDKANLGSQTEIGFIAQDMETVVPEVVGSNSDGMKSIDYPKLVALLTGAIQELKAELDSVKTAFNEYVSTHP